MTAKPRTAERDAERYRAFVEQSSEGIWCLEFSRPLDLSLPPARQVAAIYDEGRISEANDALARMIGLSCAAEVVGLPIGSVIGSDATGQGDLFDNFVRDGYRLVQGETCRADAKRTFVHAMTGTVEGHRLTRIWGTQRDVSDYLRLTEELRQAQKMEAIGQLAGGVAHDFNNLLTAIIGYSELVRDGLGADHHLAHDVEEILKAGSRAEALTRQLLAFSRKQILRPELLDLNEVVREFSTMLGRLIGEDVRMEMALSPGLSSVRADRGQIEQVIMNLAVNARDAMPHGGTLAIETHDVELDEDYLDEHPRAAAGHYVCLALSDTGLGMPPAVRARIFEPFFSTKGSKGTGLGLSTAYGIVEQSGGRILVYSEPGLGTTFKVYLPANGRRPESRSVPPVESAAGLSGTETVLVVEDDDTVRDLSVRALAGCGYRVFDAAAAEQALTIARQPGTHIDALVTDLVMPGLDGHSLADLLSISRSNLRVLYSSGYSPAVALQHGVRVDKGRAFIQKPYSGVRLARAVRTLLDRPVAVP